MYRLRLYSVGKTKESWLDAAVAEYQKRLQSTVQIECIWAKNDSHLLDLVSKETNILCLDAAGEQMTSESFSQFLIKEFEKGGARLAMVIGGADGLPPELKKGKKLISLSLMTFTHQMVRLILIEQVYRAFEINRGSQYHR